MIVKLENYTREIIKTSTADIPGQTSAMMAIVKVFWMVILVFVGPLFLMCIEYLKTIHVQESESELYIL